ncbi:MAG: DUF454 family protein [Clostridium sp.]|nr:DUF454 family protein [Clostridium sp.]MBP3215162.1 DUF454 family protein [Clostridium sp.]
MKRILFIVGGCIFLILGIIGLALPVIPQVPFLVIGVLFLARGSKKVHQMLVTNPLYEEKVRPVIEKNRFLKKFLDETEAQEKTTDRNPI